MFAMMLAAACAPEKPGSFGAERRVQSGRESEAVLQVGSEELSVHEVQERLAKIRMVLPGAQADDAQLATVLEFELLADEAERLGYGDDPRVVNAVKDALAEQAPDGVETAGATELDVAKVEAALAAGRAKDGPSEGQ